MEARPILISAMLLAGCRDLPDHGLRDPQPPRPIQRGAQAVALADLYVSPTGDDASSGTRSDAPLATLQAALDRAGAGTTVHVASGTYFGQAVTRSGGTPAHPLLIDGRGATLDGSDLPWSQGNDQNQALLELRHPWIRVRGLEVAHSRNTGILLAADHLTVASCSVHDTERHGISSDTALQLAAGGSMIQDITLRDNEVYATVQGGNGDGQAISLIADGFRIEGNRVHDNGDIGIDLWLGACHGEVTANLVHDNNGGIYVDGGHDLRIDGNRVFSNNRNPNGVGTGIGVAAEDERYQTSDIWVYNNLVYDQTGLACFLWAPHDGIRGVVFAHNTLVRVAHCLSFSGGGNQAEAVDNLGFATDQVVVDETSDSTVRLHHNTWLMSPKGFQHPDGADFRLTADSPAIAKGIPVPPSMDDTGHPISIAFDFAGNPYGPIPCTGAYQAPSGN